jgi:hypothetical protein
MTINILFEGSYSLSIFAISEYLPLGYCKCNKYEPFLRHAMIYFHFTPEDTDIIYNRMKSSTSPDHEKIIDHSLNIKMGISGKSWKELSITRILTCLLYISIFIPTFNICIFEYSITSSLLMETLILSVTVLVSLGIYAVDKPFLHEYIAWHIFIVLLLFILQLLFLNYFY